MEIQSISFGDFYSVTKVQLYIDDYYPFERWDDIVVSDFIFSYQSKEYRNVYGVFDNAYLSYQEQNTFNSKGLLVSKKKDFIPFFGYLYKYIYDSNGRLIFCWRNGGDGPGGTYTIYEYEKSEDKYPSIIHQLVEVNQITEKSEIQNPYLHDENGLLLRYEDNEESKQYFYEKNELKKIMRMQKDPEVQSVLFYQDGKCILEEYSNWTYIYQYNESGILRYKIPIITNNAQPEFTEYITDSNNRIQQIKGWTHKSW